MRVLGKVAAAIRLLGMLVAFVIAIGIALEVLDAKDQDLVATFLDICRFLVAPFRGLLDLEDNELQLGVNWGIAALVYLVVALVLAALIGRLGRRRAH